MLGSSGSSYRNLIEWRMTCVPLPPPALLFRRQEAGEEGRRERRGGRGRMKTRRGRARAKERAGRKRRYGEMRGERKRENGRGENPSNHSVWVDDPGSRLRKMIRRHGPAVTSSSDSRRQDRGPMAGRESKFEEGARRRGVGILPMNHRRNGRAREDGGQAWWQQSP